MRMNPHPFTALLAAALLATGAFAASATTKTSPSTSQAQDQTQTCTQSSLTVTYYAGDPLAGGKRLSSTTVQPQPRGTTTPANPFADAPAGATYVSITSDHGTRILTVKDAQTRAFADRGGRGGGRGHGDRGGGFGGQGGRGEHTHVGDIAGLRLPGLGDAGSVAFYTTDPLAGGKAQSTIKLSTPRTTSQQQAITQAAATAKYAVVTRDGETRIINLSVPSAKVR